VTGSVPFARLLRPDLTAHTLRYYERIGLLPYADRNRSSHRDYDASILTRRIRG
jgi:DNA-binding transcriptional MerR regulator